MHKSKISYFLVQHLKEEIWKRKLQRFFPIVFNKLNSSGYNESWKNEYLQLCVSKKQVVLPGNPFFPGTFTNLISSLQGARNVIKAIWVHEMEPLSRVLKAVLAEYVETLGIREDDFELTRHFVVEFKKNVYKS